MMKHLRASGLLMLLLVFTVGCRTESAGGQESPQYTMTDEEKAEGWEFLFDGTGLDKWRGYKWETVPPNWTVEDGAITCSPCVGGDENLPGDWKKSNDLITKEQFRSFDLKLEWKISPAGNSGIMYRVQESHDYPYMTGPEMQILDDRRHKDSLNGANRLSGAAYDVYAPSEDAARSAGDWNTARILVDSTHVEHWINGKKVVEYELLSEDWENRIAESKWESVPDYGRMDTGHIALQDHDDAVWYRNIRIKELP